MLLGNTRSSENIKKMRIETTIPKRHNALGIRSFLGFP
jgi:hypothetical protein